MAGELCRIDSHHSFIELFLGGKLDHHKCNLSKRSFIPGNPFDVRLFLYEAEAVG